MRTLLITLSCAAAGLAGLALARFPLGASSLWPASGVAVAALCLWGKRYWPLVLIAGAWVNGRTGSPWPVMLMSGVGNAIGALAGSWALNRVLQNEAIFEHQTETAAFFAAGWVTGILSALGGVLGRALFVPLPGRTIADALVTWSVGDALGVWVIAPSLLLLARRRLSAKDWRDLAVVSVLTIAVATVIFRGTLPIEASFLFLPLLMTIAGVWGEAGTKVAALWVAVVSFGGTLSGMGPLVGHTVSETHLHMQLFLGVISLTALALCGFRAVNSLRFAGVTLGIGWLLSAGLFHSFNESAKREEYQHLVSLADEGGQALRNRMALFADALYGVAALHASHPETERASWRLYIERLRLFDRHHSLTTIGTIRVVPDEMLGAFVKKMRSSGTPNYTLKNPHSAPGQRHYIVQYANGKDGERAELEGLDLCNIIPRRLPAELSGDTGQPALSGRVRLQRWSELSNGLALNIPIYANGLPTETVEQRRAALRGLAFESFSAEDFVREALGPLLSEVQFDLFDGGTANAKESLFSSEASPLPLELVRTIMLRQHRFTLGWRRAAGFSAHGTTLAAWVGTFGIFFSLLVAVLVVNLAQITRRARAIADQQTARLRSSERLLSALLDHLPLAIYCKSLQPPHPIVFWNRQCEQMIGMSRDEVIGRTTRDIFAPDYAEHSSETDRAAIAMRGEILSLAEQTFRSPKLGDIQVHTRKCVVEGSGDEPGYLLGITEDVTARKRNRQQLIEAREAALAATRAKSEFLANMSHELRTPLNAVIGLSGLLHQSNLPPESRELARVIRQSGDALLTVINDILDYSKLEAGEMQLDHQSWDLSELVQGSCAILNLDAKAKALALEIDIAPDLPPVVVGDPKRVRQVLLNLLNNAVKFTARGGVTVSVMGQPTAPDATLLRFEVADTGIGIPRSAHSRLFQAFSQVNSSSTRHHSGTGLGLSICKRLVERMGGQIGFTSQEGVGSRFWFTLPVTHPVRHRFAPAPMPRASEESTGQWTILVAEDNPSNELVIRAVLQQLGYRAVVVPDGTEALRAWQTAHFDLILLDCQMPGMDGYETARAIRAAEQPSGRHIPILALTAHAQDQQQRILDSGMDGWLGKPIDVDALGNALRTYLPGDAPPDSRGPQILV